MKNRPPAAMASNGSIATQLIRITDPELSGELAFQVGRGRITNIGEVHAFGYSNGAVAIVAFRDRRGYEVSMTREKAIELRDALTRILSVGGAK